jgi:hypothetical protein
MRNRPVSMLPPRNDTDTGTMAASHDAEAVMLDFVEPARPGRRGLSG